MRGGGVSQHDCKVKMLQQRLELSALASCRLVDCFVAYTHIERGFAAVIQLVLESHRPEYTWSSVVICKHFGSQKACFGVTSPSSTLREQIVADFRFFRLKYIPDPCTDTE